MSRVAGPEVVESCRCPVLSSSACATVRSHVRYSNTLSIMLRTSDRTQADWRNAHDAHRDDLAKRADPSSADTGPPARPARRTPRSSAVQAGRGAPALPGHRSLDVDGVASASADHPGDNRRAGSGGGWDHGVAGVRGALRRHVACRPREGGSSDARPARRGAGRAGGDVAASGRTGGT